MQLLPLLKKTFGFSGFRANQEAVCRAATDGKDVLLVMPTGAGKSLCYQLPAVAREGTALVVSPLIALMDDQANKIADAGLRVARIHSGLSREESRQACRDYLDGNLQFLFIAPERMRVPGFPEMLARKKPTLIAIDEAHCISAWGHDFRPDYRLLGQYLPALRPAPIIALTATATPTVQSDIVTQLGLQQPALFIHGFRRENLHIEVLELSKPRRPQFILEFLEKSERRPAIVYAPSRKIAEELAGQLGRRFPAAAYHAGLDPSVRERVQRDFLTGKLQVVVATIAFGMGIDKADVRTVVHAALPASVESFYQEIGRAGRDGLPSRTVLLHSYADRKMHDFFLDRDYPPVNDLQRVAAALTDEYQMTDILAGRLKMSSDILARSIEKLAVQNIVQTDMAGNVRRANGFAAGSAWQTGYDKQIAFRRAQIDRMQGFAETQQCRMTALIRHFGDTADGIQACGHCDFCAPDKTQAQRFIEPSASQDRDLHAILRALDGATPRATGRLFTDLALGCDRRSFDRLLKGLSRAGLTSFASDSFVNSEGKMVPYKKVSLTYEGQILAPGTPLGVTLSDDLSTSSDSPPRKRKAGKHERKGAPETLTGSSRQKPRPREQEVAELPPGEEHHALVQSLKSWRTQEATRLGRPAFIVLSDAVLHKVARSCPVTLTQLASVEGIGPAKLDSYGEAICSVCRGETKFLQAPTSVGQPRISPRVKTSNPALRQGEFREVDQAQGSKDRPSPAESDIGALADDDRSTGQEESAPKATRILSSPAASDTFNVEQQALEVRLREWRKSESERLGLPQFFILGTTALRSIVIDRPRTLPELGSIPGIGPDKLDRFGLSILTVCGG